MVNMLHRKKCVNDGFSVSKLEILMLQTRNMENRPKSTKTWNCKHCWMKMIYKHKNNSQNNWALVIKLFQSPTRDGKDSESWQMGATWIERETDGETQKHMWNFDRTMQKKVILASLLGMKSGFFENPKRKKSWVDPGAPSTSIARPMLWQEDDALCLVGPEGCGLLWAIEAWRNG